MFGRKKKERIYPTWADTMYQVMLQQYNQLGKCIHSQMEILKQTYNVYKLLPTEEWAKKVEKEKVYTLKLYDDWVKSYNDTYTYWENNRNHMNKCATWNKTLMKPDEWMRKWV